MEFERLVLFLAVVFSVLGHISSDLGADCSDGSNCTNSLNYVCDPADSKCKVKADRFASDCNYTDANCPTNARCNVDICSCNAGYKHKYFTGLCTALSTILCKMELQNSTQCSKDYKPFCTCAVLGTYCSDTVACHDTTNYVCDNMGFAVCKVKADGIATGCEGEDNNCPYGAVCINNTCRCKTGYRENAGLCENLLGTICAKDSECEALLTNSYCGIISPCKKGNCACSDGYSGYDCQTLGYGKTCQTGNDKCDSHNGLVCDPTSRKCVCSRSDQTYKIEVSHCTDKNLLGEKCKNVTDCYSSSNDYRACTDNKCTCPEGYVEEKRVLGFQGCRPPFAGEKHMCAITCGKFPSAFLRGDTSQVEPTCINNKCSCATSGESMYSANFRSLCISYCLTDLSSDEQEKDIGENCTALNQCKSKFCAKCPGDTHGTCYEAPCEKPISDGGRIEATVITLCLSMVLYFISLLT